MDEKKIWTMLQANKIKIKLKGDKNRQKIQLQKLRRLFMPLL